MKFNLETDYFKLIHTSNEHIPPNIKRTRKPLILVDQLSDEFFQSFNKNILYLSTNI